MKKHSKENLGKIFEQANIRMKNFDKNFKKQNF
jgi:hypothetical protein